MDEPKLTEVSVSASVGGKVQVVKYELSGDFHYTIGGKWTVPDDWSEEKAEKFRQYQMAKFVDELETPAQRSLDELYRQRDELN